MRLVVFNLLRRGLCSKGVVEVARLEYRDLFYVSLIVALIILLYYVAYNAPRLEPVRGYVENVSIEPDSCCNITIDIRVEKPVYGVKLAVSPSNSLDCYFIVSVIEWRADKVSVSLLGPSQITCGDVVYTPASLNKSIVYLANLEDINAERNNTIIMFALVFAVIFTTSLWLAGKTE